jgi:uncharacterized membrane protein
MSNKKTTIYILILITASVLLGIILYPNVPDQMASHWNIEGEVDGYISKFWGLFLMPLISIALLILFTIIPKIDPLKENIEKFRKYFNNFIALIILYLLYIHGLTVSWALGYQFNMTLAILPAMGVLFYFIGELLEHSKRNWFIGIRTPWTLSSDNVWNKTNKLGAKLFRLSGVLIILGLLIQKYVLWLILAPILSSVLFLVIYSYLEYQKENNKS